MILNNVTGIMSNESFYCTDDFNNASTIVMWAVYENTEGIKSKEIGLTSEPATSAQPSTVTTVTTSSSSKGNVTFENHKNYGKKSEVD